MKSSETVQRHPRKRLSCVLVPLLILLIVVPPQAFADWEAWENGRAYTKMLKKAAYDAAKEAVALAAAVVAAAAVDLAAAQAAVAAAGGTGVATTAATLARLAAAEAALAAATATLAAAKAAAAAAAAVVAGAAIGTYAGQGLRGIWSWCWDPVCDLTAKNQGNGPIYVQATEDEIKALIPEVLSAGGFENIDFSDSPVARDFLSMGIGQFLNATRGAAAATARRPAEIHAAMCDMQADMYTYRDVTEAIADVLAKASYEDPSADLAAARSEFDAAVEEAMDVCDPKGGDDCDAIKAYLDEATASFQSAQDEIATFHFPTLVGNDDSIFAELSLREFHEFIEDCAANGERCLPQVEIDLVNTLAAAAGVYSPSEPSLGAPIAEYDAMGDTGGREGALFNPDTGLINLAELLKGAATELSGSGSMFNIDLVASPLAADANYDPTKCTEVLPAHEELNN